MPAKQRLVASVPARVDSSPEVGAMGTDGAGARRDTPPFAQLEKRVASESARVAVVPIGVVNERRWARGDVGKTNVAFADSKPYRDYSVLFLKLGVRCRARNLEPGTPVA